MKRERTGIRWLAPHSCAGDGGFSRPLAASHLIMLALGIEGSANKVGVGIVAEDGTILANPRKT
jgi:hypothetical protein